MRVLFLSDTHIGFKNRAYPERSEDPFKGLEEALKVGGDLIVHGGDLFDTHRPSFEDIRRTISIIKQNTSVGEKKEVTVETLDGENVRSFYTEKAPFIAVHGNHDWNVRGSNVYEMLDEVGVIVYAHRRRVIVEGDEKKVIVGMGWIPDNYVLSVIEDYRNTKGDYFLFHQAVEGLYPDTYGDKPVPPSAFPREFELYLGGHLHWQVDREINGKRFLIPGSTTITSLRGDEIKRPRSVYVIEGDDVKKVELQNLRKAYEIEANSLEEASKKIYSLLESLPPIIKVKGNVDESVLRKLFKGKALIYVYPTESVEEISYLKREIDTQSFDDNTVLRIFREQMGDKWEPWMEELINILREGDTTEGLMFLEDVKPKERKSDIVSWLEE